MKAESKGEKNLIENQKTAQNKVKCIRTYTNM